VIARRLVPGAGVALSQGARARQEDAVLAHPAVGQAPAIAALSDGIGGHDDGDIAARILAGTVFASLFEDAARPEGLARDPEGALLRAAETANGRLAAEMARGRLATGAGGTLIAVLLSADRLAWLSVGDSLLALWRGGDLTRLNADHSLSPRIDLMADRVGLTPQQLASHPQRSLLTSAVTGAPIPRVEVRSGVALAPGDRVLLASDGLLTLELSEVARTLARTGGRPPQAMAEAVIRAVTSVAAPGQDNVAVAVLAVPGSPVQPLARSGHGPLRPLSGSPARTVAPGPARTAQDLSGGDAA